MAKKIFKDKSINDLQHRAEELKAELFALRFQSVTRQLEKPHRIKELRREVARILTHLQMRKDSGEVVKPLNQQKVVISETLQKEIDQKTKVVEEKAKLKLKEKKLVVEKQDNVVTEQIELENQKLVAKKIKKVKDVVVPVIKKKKAFKKLKNKDSKEEASVKTAKVTKSKSVTIIPKEKTDEKRGDNDGKK
ncbi:50S ribosomal protein L29 [Spiroplasma endosymbiont of Agriotes lineatus]|uniref:50S ribosomal protein L29 n=1 Tax=Spiroplasma endosymbiont of Agriotes lineatus TaxID=3077930 RepID=UPI0030D46B7C